MSFFGKNIKKIRGVKGLSQQAFAEVFDLKRATLGAYEEGRSEPKIETIIKIANYFSIPIDDLLTSELTVNKLLQFKGDLTLQAETVHKEVFAKIPCITEKTASDYLKYHTKETFINDLPTVQLPVNPEKNFRAYTITNLEMANHDNGLYPKDVVIGEFVPKNVVKKLNNGVLVFVLVENELILRRLYTTKDTIVLRADHKNVADKTFAFNEVKELWKVRYVFFRRLPEINTGVEDKLQFLEQEFAKLKDRF